MTNIPHPDVIPGIYIPSKDRIAEKVAEEYDISVDDLYIKTRRTKIVEPRQVFISIAKYALDLTNQEIADMFGQTNATVVHARKCLRNFYVTNKHYRKKIDFLLQKLFLFESDREMILNKMLDNDIVRSKSLEARSKVKKNVEPIKK